MSDELHDLKSRLERLERENKRWKRWGAAACGGVGLLGLLGMAAPAICDVLSGERLVLRDEGGRQRLVIDAYHNDAPTLTLQSRDGRALAKLGINDEGEAYLNLYDKQGASKSSYKTSPCDAPKTQGSAEAQKVVKN